jgi:cyclin H
LIEPARNNLKQSRFTDAELIYTPSQIAIACLRLSSSAGKEMVAKYLEAKNSRAKAAREREREEREEWARKKSKNGKEGTAVVDLTDDSAEQTILQPNIDGILNEIERLIEEKMRTAHGDVEQVKPIDKKLKLCQNPENMPNSRM